MIRQSWRPLLQSAAVVAAAVAAAGCVGTARADEVATIHPEAKVWSPSTVRCYCNRQQAFFCIVCCHVLQSWQILPLSTRQRTFFKYEKRIRDLSGPDKIFEYFATETKEDGSRSVPSGSLGYSADDIALTTAHVTLHCLPQTCFPSSALSRTGHCYVTLFAQSTIKPSRQNTHFSRLQNVQLRP